MDKQTFQSMIERRGYDLGVHFVEQGGRVTACRVGDHEAGLEMSFDGGQFEKMMYEEARDRLDVSLAEGMRHVVHSCGQVLLEANDWWSGMGPYSDFELGFYRVPLTWGSKPVYYCPRCEEKLNLEGEGEFDEVDYQEYYDKRLTVLPRVEDI